MKIVVKSDNIGKFVWEVPPKLTGTLTQLSEIGRDKLKLSKREIENMERAMNAELAAVIESFLRIVTAAYMCGGLEAVVAQELIKAKLEELNRTTRAILTES